MSDDPSYQKPPIARTPPALQLKEPAISPLGSSQRIVFKPSGTESPPWLPIAPKYCRSIGVLGSLVQACRARCAWPTPPGLPACPLTGDVQNGRLPVPVVRLSNVNQRPAPRKV